MTDRNRGTVVYRVWLVRCKSGCPARNSLPVDALVVGEAEPGHMEQNEAATYVETFNRKMSKSPNGIWAAAVATELHYNGDLESGRTVAECRSVNSSSPAPKS